MSRVWQSGRLGAAFEDLAAGLSASELWSLLMAVLDRRAAARSPAEVLAQYQRDPFTQPAPIDQRELTALDAELLAAASAFEGLELSPVAPLGSCSVVALASQNKVLSALRGTEVCADPTNQLALECARRLRAAPDAEVRLATCQRVMRAQQLPKVPGYTQHFRMFALATAGRERQDHALVVGALVEQIRTMLAALDRLEARGYAFPGRRLRVLATPARAQLGDRVAAAIDGVEVAREPLDHPYYAGGLRYLIDVRGPDGGEMPLIDGGAFDWVARLSENRRNVFVASGMGSQLVALLFRRR